MPWFDIYDEADARRRERIRANGGVIAPSGAVLYPAPAGEIGTVEHHHCRCTPLPAATLPPEPPSEPAMPSLLGWIVALIVRR